MPYVHRQTFPLNIYLGIDMSYRGVRNKEEAGSSMAAGLNPACHLPVQTGHLQGYPVSRTTFP